jgi:hypothetical protein
VKGIVNAQGARAALASHVSGGDIPTTHRSYDLNVDVLPDPAYAALLGGNPTAETGNFAEGGDEVGRVHSELETIAIPPFAWPEPGQRVEILGSWTWDCGHWLPGGERTELHPFRALWVERKPSPRSPSGENEGDVFVTTDKTGAGKVADCAHRTKGDRGAFKACFAAEPNWQDVTGSYRFYLPAPKKPSAAARLRFRVVDAGSTPGAPRARLEPDARGVHVLLDVPATASPGLRRLVVAQRILVGWSPLPERARPVHLRIRFVRLLARRAMDPACRAQQPNCPLAAESTQLGQNSTLPGEWNVYLDVAGIWGMWNPKSLLVRRDGQSFPGHRSVDFYVPRGAPWRLFVSTRECDFGAFGSEGTPAPLYPCPRQIEVGVRAGDDVPGNLVARFRSPSASLGLHRSDAQLLGSTCPTSNRRGCYRVTYRVSAIPGG